MPFRRVQQQSDRGSIKDLANGDDEKLPPTEEELRLKKLYEHGLATRDEALLASLGLIAINGAPKDPIAIFRHKEYIESLKGKLAEQIKQTSDELAPCFAVPDDRANRTTFELARIKWKQEGSLNTILDDGSLVKNASTTPRRSFRRVIE
jgi:hypothetical protein